MDQQHPDVTVAALAYSAENLAITARTLLRDQPQPGREMTAGAKALGIVHCQNEGGCGYRARPRDGHQPLAGLRLLRPRFEGLFGLPNPQLRFAYLLEQ